ncbi:uncharacterized protein PHALS_03918 [Plasmopara halstedii]|uniref:Uncharacterized protein n=1 Tax=Plasmopara halstedii TaxID=4781 RepID=A0A0P1B0T6_PLAHL|nr:uncharacterized protein PHALS_03918 [Plasmopara halstedii]CEG47272.1 hypothetical protein PHALS_03918 [Plasmopara halstedii]|eukprot:XP_024583641.1 hypothetical protein PHALS_03918 [Plasmopara halstedii]
MVSTSISKRSTDVGLNDMTTKSPTTCRYKTGKCQNTRSRKRNGQPHQLCLYHRDKANMTQRKFDRQKRHAARSQKSCGLHDVENSSFVSMLENSAHKLPSVSTDSTASSRNSASSLSDLSDTSEAVHMYSPDSPDCELNESVWAEIPEAASSYFIEYADVSMDWHQSYLSTDEIDFLCSAILE